MVSLSATRRALALLMLAVSTVPALATYSIILVDRNSKEIAVGSATCVPGINLKQHTPVVRVAVGAATAQSQVDTSGQNRQLIWEQLQLGTRPDEMLDLLEAQDSLHPRRQYGIVDTKGRAATFSGAENGNFKGGVTGQVGTIVYAIQGNVITGQAVIDAAEDAVRNTSGDLAEKLIAAMEAAHVMGGDGRCSCDRFRPDQCGAPPPNFDPATDRSAYVGYLIVARRGDTDGGCDADFGCASGDYYIRKNVSSGGSGPDPTITLRQRLDSERLLLVGVPDQVRSVLEITPNRLPNDGQATAPIHVQILDWQGLPAEGVENVEIMHDPDEATGASTIGPLTQIDAVTQVYAAELTGGTTPGVDRIAVRVTYGGGVQRFLMPSARVALQDLAYDLNSDGVIDLRDLQVLLAGFGVNESGDLDGDGDTDISDLGLLLTVPGLGLPSGA
jgi:uncharacterized Ntn-hydrolase superfamily protein